MRREELAERERERQEHKEAIERSLREADMERSLRQQEAADKLASHEALERERMQIHNSKEVRVKRASDLLHKSIQPIPKNAEDVPSWFVAFETQLMLNGVSDDVWLPLLNQFLTDKARRLVDRLPASDIDTYEKLHNAIMREYDLTPSAYKRFFDKAQRMEGETWVQLCTRLQTRLKYYLESREIDKSYERLCELLVADKFKTLLPNSLHDFVRQRELEKWLAPQDLARVVDTYVADRHTSAGEGDQGGSGRRGAAVNRAAVAGGD